MEQRSSSPTESDSDSPLASAPSQSVAPRLTSTSASAESIASRSLRRQPRRSSPSSSHDGRHGRRCHRLRTILFVATCMLLWCTTPCEAASYRFEDMAAASGYSEIFFDSRPAPEPRVRVIKRAAEADASGSTKRAVSSSLSTTSTSPLPSPFDSSLGNNFTAASCPTFFQSFLSNSTFSECLPLSLLLQVCAAVTARCGFTSSCSSSHAQTPQASVLSTKRGRHQTPSSQSNNPQCA